MVLSDSIWKDYTDTGRSTGSYIVFYKGIPFDHCTHVPGPVSQSSAESEYNSVCITGMALSSFIILNNELMNKYQYMVPEHAPIIIFDKKSSVCMANNSKDTKHTRHIPRSMHLVRNRNN